MLRPETALRGQVILNCKPGPTPNSPSALLKLTSMQKALSDLLPPLMRPPSPAWSRHSGSLTTPLCHLRALASAVPPARNTLPPDICCLPLTCCSEGLPRLPYLSLLPSLFFMAHHQQMLAASGQGTFSQLLFPALSPTWTQQPLSMRWLTTRRDHAAMMPSSTLWRGDWLQSLPFPIPHASPRFLVGFTTAMVP